MRSELADADKPKRRITRSRLAKPLLTSMGGVTMLAASTFVLLAVASTGSASPRDWTRADPAAALRLCAHQGLGTFGCMLSGAFRPASASHSSGANRALQPMMSVATVPDQVSGDGSAQGARTGSGTKSGTKSGSGTNHTQHRVNVPAGASMDDVLTACATAMKTASTQGTTAMKEVEDECESDLESRCPAVKTPTASGTAAITEMRDECEPARSPSPRPSGSPRGFVDE